jgi:nucleoside-diphosphate-sugar epimerase
MKILITGVAGLIGSNLLKGCSTGDIRSSVWTIFSRPFSNVAPFLSHPCFTLSKVFSILKSLKLSRVMSSDFHLAALKIPATMAI